MINGKRVLALIPARGGSKGLPKKNILKINNKPLLAYPISAAKASKFIDRVVVSTENEDIASIAILHGADVPFKRPIELASDTASSISVIRHALQYLNDTGDNYDYIALLEPTSPLTENKDIDIAIEYLDSKRKIADSIVGVSKVISTHPDFNVRIGNDGLIKSFNKHKKISSLRRQDISDIYYFDGSLYISDINVLIKKGTFYHDRTIPYITPKWKSFEIDDYIDFICVEAIMKNLSKIKKRG